MPDPKLEALVRAGERLAEAIDVLVCKEGCSVCAGDRATLASWRSALADLRAEEQPAPVPTPSPDSPPVTLADVQAYHEGARANPLQDRPWHDSAAKRLNQVEEELRLLRDLKKMLSEEAERDRGEIHRLTDQVAAYRAALAAGIREVGENPDDPDWTPATMIDEIADHWATHQRERPAEIVSTTCRTAPVAGEMSADEIALRQQVAHLETALSDTRRMREWFEGEWERRGRTIISYQSQVTDERAIWTATERRAMRNDAELRAQIAAQEEELRLLRAIHEAAVAPSSGPPYWADVLDAYRAWKEKRG